jgi:hypothetical protein
MVKLDQSSAQQIAWQATAIDGGYMSRRAPAASSRGAGMAAPAVAAAPDRRTPNGSDGWMLRTQVVAL